MVMMLGSPIVALPGLLVTTTSTFFCLNVDFGSLISGGKSFSSSTLVTDPFAPFCFVEQRCFGAGEGDKSKISLMSLPGSVFEAGSFPPPYLLPNLRLGGIG